MIVIARDILVVICFICSQKVMRLVLDKQMLPQRLGTKRAMTVNHPPPDYSALYLPKKRKTNVWSQLEKEKRKKITVIFTHQR